MTKGRNESTDSLDDLESQISKICCIDLPIPSEARSCCIYAVPVTLIEINGKKAYQPRVVSIADHRALPPQQASSEGDEEAQVGGPQPFTP
jgi:hypothetical protein